jgi:hypothetical protein
MQLGARHHELNLLMTSTGGPVPLLNCVYLSLVILFLPFTARVWLKAEVGRSCWDSPLLHGFEHPLTSKPCCLLKSRGANCNLSRNTFDQKGPPKKDIIWMEQRWYPLNNMSVTLKAFINLKVSLSAMRSLLANSIGMDPDTEELLRLSRTVRIDLTSEMMVQL